MKHPLPTPKHRVFERLDSADVGRARGPRSAVVVVAFVGVMLVLCLLTIVLLVWVVS